MTADAIIAELLSDSARADPYPQYRALRELGPTAPLTQGVAGVTPFAAFEKLVSLGFGAGPHYCVGAAVARAEGGGALPRRFERFPKLALPGQPVGAGSLFLRGMSSVPVTLS